jgi:hypothetical protein
MWWYVTDAQGNIAVCFAHNARDAFAMARVRLVAPLKQLWGYRLGSTC